MGVHDHLRSFLHPVKHMVLTEEVIDFRTRTHLGCGWESLVHKPQSEGSKSIFGLGSPQVRAYIYIRGLTVFGLFLWATYFKHIKMQVLHLGG